MKRVIIALITMVVIGSLFLVYKLGYTKKASTDKMINKVLTDKVETEAPSLKISQFEDPSESVSESPSSETSTSDKAEDKFVKISEKMTVTQDVSKENVTNETVVSMKQSTSDERTAFRENMKCVVHAIGIKKEGIIELLEASYFTSDEFVEKNPSVFESVYSEESITKNTVDVCLIALMEFGFDENLIWNSDWNVCGEDLVTIVNELLTKKGYKNLKADDSGDTDCSFPAEWIDFSTENWLEAYELLVEFEKILEKQDVYLCELGRGNDAYEIFLIAQSDYDAFIKACQKLGFSCSKFM